MLSRSKPTKRRNRKPQGPAGPLRFNNGLIATKARGDRPDESAAAPRERGRRGWGHGANGSTKAWNKHLVKNKRDSPLSPVVDCAIGIGGYEARQDCKTLVKLSPLLGNLIDSPTSPKEGSTNISEPLPHMGNDVRRVPRVRFPASALVPNTPIVYIRLMCLQMQIVGRLGDPRAGWIYFVLARQVMESAGAACSGQATSFHILILYGDASQSSNLIYRLNRAERFIFCTCISSS